MKKAVMFLVATTMLLGACSQEEEGKQKNTDTNEIVKKENVKNDDEQSGAELELKESETKEKQGTHSQENSDKQKHSQDVSDKFGLMAEDIIVMYFNAISLKDVDTLKTINPNAVVENEQYEKLFQISDVKADVQDMEKVTVNEKEAEYRVSVKLYTKENDDNFTDNVSDYVLKIDLEKGVFITKQVSNNTFIE